MIREWKGNVSMDIKLAHGWSGVASHRLTFSLVRELKSRANEWPRADLLTNTVHIQALEKPGLIDTLEGVGRWLQTCTSPASAL